MAKDVTNDRGPEELPIISTMKEGRETLGPKSYTRHCQVEASCFLGPLATRHTRRTHSAGGEVERKFLEPSPKPAVFINWPPHAALGTEFRNTSFFLSSEEEEQPVRLSYPVCNFCHKCSNMSIQLEISSLTADIDELQKLMEQATRLTIKTLLMGEISRLSLRKKKLEDELAASSSLMDECVSYQAITQYAWDQSDKFMKIFIEPKVPVEESDIKFTITGKRSFVLTFKGYRLQILKLGGDIEAEGSSFKVSKGKITLCLKKQKEKVPWSSLKEKEETWRKSHEEDKDEIGAGDDPSAGLMKLMKKMYDEGDDDMKRTIAKSWYESQHKSPTSDIPDFSM